jgi:hypothetical protein
MPSIVSTTAEQRLAQLTARARAELNMLSFATKPWVVPKTFAGRTIPDVVVIGAGQSGLVLGQAPRPYQLPDPRPQPRGL